MNLRLSLILLLLALSLFALCQPGKDAPASWSKCGDLSLTAPESGHTFTYPAIRVEILDLRQDTSKFGYYYSQDGVHASVQFCFRKNTSSEITAFLNGYYHTDRAEAGSRLLYCLKKLWITSSDTIDTEKPKAWIKRSRLYLKAELYLAKDSCFYPLYRFDSVFTYDKSPTATSTTWVEEALIRSLEPLNRITVQQVVKRNCMPQTEMTAYYTEEKKSLAPPSSPARGVYLSVEDFIHNRPTYRDFSVTFGKLADILEVKDEQGRSSVLKRDWGYCDSTQCFIRLAQNYYRLFKTGNTFEIYASPVNPVGGYGPQLVVNPVTTGRENMIGQMQSGYLHNARKIVSKLRPLQLDMETGKVYY